MTGSKERAVASIQHARTQLEAALEELQRLPASDPHSLAFSAHALNNFLSVTSGTVEILMHALKAHPDPQVRVWLEGLQHATSLMSHTVSCLMSIASVGEVKLRWEEIDLSVMLQRICNYYQRIAGRKQILIICETPENKPSIWSDRVALSAVLDNLMSNAVKFSPPGEQIRVDLKTDSDFAICGVHDRGPGLTAQDHAGLFQKGAKLSAMPTGNEDSSGYGLAVAKMFVEKLLGKIRCESHKGHGSSFYLYLPVYRKQVHGTHQNI